MSLPDFSTINSSFLETYRKNPPLFWKPGDFVGASKLDRDLSSCLASSRGATHLWLSNAARGAKTSGGMAWPSDGWPNFAAKPAAAATVKPAAAEADELWWWRAGSEDTVEEDPLPPLFVVSWTVPKVGKLGKRMETTPPVPDLSEKHRDDG